MISGYSAERADWPPFSLAPGDQVIHFVDRRPYFYTIVEVGPGGKVTVSGSVWPSDDSTLDLAQNETLAASKEDQGKSGR